MRSVELHLTLVRSLHESSSLFLPELQVIDLHREDNIGWQSGQPLGG
jgi:hypothetical protein